MEQIYCGVFSDRYLNYLNHNFNSFLLHQISELCQRGIFQNQDGVVTALVSNEEFCARQSEEFVEEAFSGSLPAFLTAFTRRKKLSQEEITQLQQLIDESRG